MIPGKKCLHWALPALLALISCVQQPKPAAPADSGFVTEYLTPTRIVCRSGALLGAEHLLEPYCGQVSTTEPVVTLFGPGGSVLLDFGQEIQGGIQIVRAISGSKAAARFRLCLGESVSEALSSVDAPGATATNDHSVRDMEISVPWLGTAEYGSSGFRFARLDLLDGAGDVPVVAVRAVSRVRDLPYLGSFRCSDPRLEEIWRTGAYTVHLCMQDYLWDGIKRDRLVWIGDMHPEVMTVGTVFGDQQVVRRSLDYVRDKTAPTGWMNGICSYSLWWILIHKHLYDWYGDLDYLREQQAYMGVLLRSVLSCVDGDREAYPAGRFIDWPSNDQPAVIHAGLQALTVLALEGGAAMMASLGDGELQQACEAAAQRLRGYVPDAVGNSQAAALLTLAGMMDPQEASAIIQDNGPEKFTSFMGYYILEALAAAGDYTDALQCIRAYWGRMLDLGATTFWEDFNYTDGLDAAPIDAVVPEGKFDIHADGGAWCYVGLRHSLCHGWASGPTPWLSRHVLGIEPVGAGFRQVRIEPHLGDLKWAEGTFPTPYGVIEVSHRKGADGKVVTKAKLPRGVRRVQ